MQPPVEEVQASFRLVEWNHVPRRMDPHKRQVAAALHLAVFLTLTANSEGSQVHLIVRRLARPVQRFRPGIIAQPVADKVSVPLARGQHRKPSSPIMEAEQVGRNLQRRQESEFAPECRVRANDTVSSSHHSTRSFGSRRSCTPRIRRLRLPPPP